MLLPAAVLLLPACKEEATPVAADPRPVRAITVERKPAGETVVLTGQISARTRRRSASASAAG